MRLRDIDMSVHVDCFPCFLKQANIALDAAGAGEDKWREVLIAVLEDIEATEFDKSPSHASTKMHRRIRQMLGLDPFARLKTRYNDLAMGLMPSLKERVRASGDPLLTAARLAIAGNIIDFGIFKEIDIDGTVERALTADMAIDHSAGFRDAVLASDRVLYLLDNSGEIVFDMLLIAEIKKLGKPVTAVVRGEPILNDCTMEDATDVGLDKLCGVIHNGSDAVGTVLEDISGPLKDEFNNPGTLIISKGQGNFETLLHSPGDIWYLLQAKCSVVADKVGVDNGAMLFINSREMA